MSQKVKKLIDELEYAIIGATRTGDVARVQKIKGELLAVVNPPDELIARVKSLKANQSGPASWHNEEHEWILGHE